MTYPRTNYSNTPGASGNKSYDNIEYLQYQNYKKIFAPSLIFCIFNVTSFWAKKFFAYKLLIHISGLSFFINKKSDQLPLADIPAE